MLILGRHFWVILQYFASKISPTNQYSWRHWWKEGLDNGRRKLGGKEDGRDEGEIGRVEDWLGVGGGLGR